MEFETPKVGDKKGAEVDYPNLHGVTDEYGEHIAGDDTDKLDDLKVKEHITAEEAIKKLREKIERRESKNDEEKEFDVEKFTKANDGKETKFDEYGEIITDEDEK